MDFYTEKSSHTLAEYDVEFFKMESDTVRILTSAQGCQPRQREKYILFHRLLFLS